MIGYNNQGIKLLPYNHINHIIWGSD